MPKTFSSIEASRKGAFSTLLLDSRSGFRRALRYAAAYSAWILLFRLLVISVIAYFVHSPHSHFQDVNEVYGSNELTLTGACALAFVLLVRGLNPLAPSTSVELFTPHRFEHRFLPGFFQGAVLAAGVVLAFMISGWYRYLGFFIQFDEAPMALGAVLFRVLALGALAYCEEFIFRRRILSGLRMHLPFWAAAPLTGLVYCAVKTLQFDLGVMHLLTLFLVSLALSIRTAVDKDFARGAGFWAAILIVFHPLLSLPVLGNEFSGVLLVKYQGASDDLMSTIRFLTGGAGGPLASFAFQAVLAVDIVRGIVRHKKILLNVAPKALR